jgi:hypothetical protein
MKPVNKPRNLRKISKHTKPDETSAERGKDGGQDAARIERKSVLREAGIGSARPTINAVASGSEYGGSPQDSNILAELVWAR